MICWPAWTRPERLAGVSLLLVELVVVVGAEAEDWVATEPHPERIAAAKARRAFRPSEGRNRVRECCIGARLLRLRERDEGWRTAVLRKD